jgi:hypothetical protein
MTSRLIADDRPEWLAGIARRPLTAGLTALTLLVTPVLVYLAPIGAVPPRLLVFALALPAALLVPSRHLALALAPAWMLAYLIPLGYELALAATGALVFGVAFRFAMGRARPHRSYIVLGLLFATILISFGYPTLPGYTDVSLLSNVLGLAAGLAATAAVVAEPPAPRRLAGVIAASGAVFACLALSAGTFDAGRLVAPDFNPNSLGAILILPIVAAVGQARSGRQPLWLLLVVPSAAALARTESRAALITAAFGTVYVLIRGRRWWQQGLIGVAAAFAGVQFAGRVAGTLLQARSATALEDGSIARMQTLRLAVRLALEHPLRGIGYGMFPSQAVMSPEPGIYMNTHDEYAHLASEAGIGALALFVLLIAWALGRRLGHDHSVLQALVLTYAVSLFFADAISNLPLTVPFWLSLGCLLGSSSGVPPAPRRLAGTREGPTRTSVPA